MHIETIYIIKEIKNNNEFSSYLSKRIINYYPIQF